MDKRLEEQLERVRQLSARVAEIHEQLSQNMELIARDREHAAKSPMPPVRDFRIWRSHDEAESGAGHRRASADDRPRSRQRRRRG